MHIAKYLKRTVSVGGNNSSVHSHYLGSPKGHKSAEVAAFDIFTSPLINDIQRSYATLNRYARTGFIIC